MPILSRLEIIDVAERILGAAGASAANAAIVAHHLADANMTGHDSHGLIRVPQYVDDIRAGHCDPGAEPEVASESGAVVRVDGHHSFGQVVAKFGTERAMEKARELGLGMATMGSLGHVGRIGSYGERAARDDMAAIMFTGLLGERAQCAPPHGGLARRFSTNPVSITFPYQSDGPLVLDFATSVGAEGSCASIGREDKTSPTNGCWTRTGSRAGIPTTSMPAGRSCRWAGSMVGIKDMHWRS